MPRRTSHPRVAVFSIGFIGGLSWGGVAAADDPQPISSGPVEEAHPSRREERREERERERDEELAKNSVFAEGLGPGLFYSINYERMVVDELGVRVGFEYLSFSATSGAGPNTASSSTTFMAIPVTASFVGIRSGKHCLELGGGVSFLYFGGSTTSGLVATSSSGIVPLGIAMVGYRLQPVERAGFMFRVGLSALVAEGLSLSAQNPSQFGVLPWPYISLGASF